MLLAKPNRLRLFPHALWIVSGADTTLCWIVHITGSYRLTTVTASHHTVNQIIRLTHTGKYSPTSCGQIAPSCTLKQWPAIVSGCPAVDPQGFGLALTMAVSLQVKLDGKHYA
jgi:hypothetical protein